MVIKNSVEMIVKKEHIDAYEHLNNSCYPLYFEKARILILDKAGLNCNELKKMGFGLFVTSSAYKYKSQTNGNQKIKIDSEIEIDRARIIVNFIMYNQTKPKAKAEIKHFFIDLKTKKATRIPKEILERLVTC